jgi:hypothetical protein
VVRPNEYAFEHADRTSCVQIVGYETANAPGEYPALLIAENGAIRTEALPPGTDLSYQLARRHCAGSVEYETGVHTPCDRESVPYCDRHTNRWACARCTGDCSLPLESCREEHAVYLAAFAPATFKVGVTRSWRLQTRLREQGADRAAHLRTVEDGRIARQIEADIASEIGDRVRVDHKRRGLHRAVDTEQWEALLADYDPIETFEFEYDFDLDARPMAEHLASGTVRGSQGRLLVLERDGTVYAVDLRELVGYEVESGETDRQLQSSFAAFE